MRGNTQMVRSGRTRVGSADARRSHPGLHHTRYRGPGARPPWAWGLHQHSGAPSAQGGVDPSYRDDRLALHLLLGESTFRRVKVQREKPNRQIGLLGMLNAHSKKAFP